MKPKHWPILSYPDEMMGLKRAAWFARKSVKTIARWCKVHGIGRQVCPGAPYEVSKPALAMVIHGDFEALELLRAGYREDPRVARYLDWAGLPN